MKPPLKVFDTAEALGRHAAEVILARWLRSARPYLTLGCPGGRSPRSTYDALADLAGEADVDGRRVHLVMMDDYVERAGGVWRACPAEAHYSCARFGEMEIRRLLNTRLSRPIPRENLHLPDPADPLRYERTIADLGGLDVFLLASGASDGHVAFNPPGAALSERTRRVELAETTRADNVATFPGFASAADVPRFGVTVGPGSILAHARAALMILIGSDKGLALRRIRQAEGYDPDWPASIVNLCRDSAVLADSAAFRASGVAS